MIQLTRLDNPKLVINVEKIQTLPETPDTVITFTNHDRIMVREPMDEISNRIMEYQRSIHNNSLFDAGLFQENVQMIN